jgi:hypothetical protein
VYHVPIPWDKEGEAMELNEITMAGCWASQGGVLIRGACLPPGYSSTTLVYILILTLQTGVSSLIWPREESRDEAIGSNCPQRFYHCFGPCQSLQGEKSSLTILKVSHLEEGQDSGDFTQDQRVNQEAHCNTMTALSGCICCGVKALPS